MDGDDLDVHEINEIVVTDEGSRIILKPLRDWSEICND